ncbi:hypothetical protein HPP92_021121 [Vanilla planifolia]|uniref:Pectate lyase n=1 Tax=Vanilla planifolia TaxID=51239 RepID=A0A835UF83_VANPL|nr:hypothetical protein HPP92_021121 [Vanilla planifolia]
MANSITVPALLTLVLCLISSTVSTSVDNHPIRRGGGHMNVIDRCWRRNRLWASRRQRLASCSAGFAGKMRNNIGPGLRWYVVTNPGDDPAQPRPGTLRYGATMIPGKVWITFAHDMQITLRSPLPIKSYTTLDGRGAVVHIARGAGLLLNNVHDVIIHGLHFYGNRAATAGTDGDAIRLVGSRKVWIDHNTLYAGEDGLVDVTRGSTDITVSNNWFHDHNKVMLLGHDDGFLEDRNMRVTVVFNRFGPNCSQRMPRIRHGYAHVANNLYDGWVKYAIGGSMNPKVKSEANLFIAPSNHKKRSPGERRRMGSNGSGSR